MEQAGMGKSSPQTFQPQLVGGKFWSDGHNGRHRHVRRRNSMGRLGMLASDDASTPKRRDPSAATMMLQQL